VARWTCPRCDREFGRARQSHTCLPGNSVDATFRDRPPEQRAICDAIVEHLRELGEVHVDAVQVGVFLKSDRKIAELRPKSKWLECTLYLPYVIDDARVARSMQLGAHRQVNFVKLRTVDDVDDEFLAWLSEAYDHNTE
jgi:uncharacterized protein DUF5655